MMRKNFFLYGSLCFWFLVSGFWFLAPSNVYGQEAYIYDSRGRRDPFVPLLGITVKSVESLEDIISIEDVSLQGIARDSSGRKTAIINGEMIKEDQTIGHVTIVKILRNEIILTIDEEEHRINIYEE